MAGEGAVHTQLLSLPCPVTCTASHLPPPGTISPSLPLYSSDQGNQSASDQGNHSASNPQDPKEIAEPHRMPQASVDSPSRMHPLMTQELEMEVGEKKEMLPIRSQTVTPTNHRVLKPHPIGNSWFLHHVLYPEWGTLYQPCLPSPPPPPHPLPYHFQTFPTNRDAETQAQISPWYPTTWCFQCHLQDSQVHTRPYSCGSHPDMSTLPAVKSSSVPFSFATTKETSAFSGSYFAHTTDILSPHK